MAHVRKRHLKDRFEKLCAFSPLVGVFGHRQTGKTTFCEKNSELYLTFDQKEGRLDAERDPDSFLKKNHSVRTVIDECQLVPEVFPALKDWVRTHKKPGQFVLTGSVKFTSRKAIRESLTGRMVSSEMLPLTVAEILEHKLPDTVLRLISAKDFTKIELSPFHVRHYSAATKAFQTYLIHGGLPGICFVRDSKTRREYLDSLINLMLDYDLRQVMDTRLPLRTIRDLLTWIAQNALRPYSYAQVKREFKLSEVTQKKLLNALESIFILRRFKSDGAKGEVFLLEDQIEEHILSDAALEVTSQKMTAFYRNIRAQFAYRSGELHEFFQYRTRGGALVPLAVKTENGILGFILMAEEEVQLSEKRSAESFIRKYPQAKVLFLSDQIKEAKALASNLLEVPLAALI